MAIKFVEVGRHGTSGGWPPFVYVGRTASVRKQYKFSAPHLANPFRIGKDGDRAAVIEKYRRWLWQQIKEQGAAYAELLSLLYMARQGGITLVCHCSPRPCHADVIAKALAWLDTQIEEE